MQRYLLGGPRWRVAGAIAGAVLVLCLCVSGAFADATVQMTEGSATDINTWGFTPADVTIAAGQSITWTNSGSQAHSATADNAGAFDTGLVQPGDSKTVAFTTPGTFTYHCTPHPWMKGTITVTAAAAAPAAPAPAPAAPAAAPPAPAAAAPVSQAAPTPTPFRFLTPTPFAARPAGATTTGTTTTTPPPPKAGGIPDGLPLVLLLAGVGAVGVGVRVLRRGRSPV